MPFPVIAAAIAGGTSLLGSLTQNAQTAATNRALADTYRTQSRLNLLNAATQNMYANEELGYDIWNLREQGEMFKSSQLSNLAASNFAISTGDKRLFSETERGIQEMVEAQNRQAYLYSYEMYKQAYLSDIQYKAQAKIADINSKYASGWRGLLTAGTNAGLSALGAYFSFADPAKNLKVNK